MHARGKTIMPMGAKAQDFYASSVSHGKAAVLQLLELVVCQLAGVPAHKHTFLVFVRGLEGVDWHYQLILVTMLIVGLTPEGSCMIRLAIAGPAGLWSRPGAYTLHLVEEW